MRQYRRLSSAGYGAPPPPISHPHRLTPSFTPPLPFSSRPPHSRARGGTGVKVLGEGQPRAPPVGLGPPPYCRHPEVWDVIRVKFAIRGRLPGRSRPRTWRSLTCVLYAAKRRT